MTQHEFLKAHNELAEHVDRYYADLIDSPAATDTMVNRWEKQSNLAIKAIDNVKNVAANFPIRQEKSQ